MRTRKIFDLVRRLNARDRELFAEYLCSPLHFNRPKFAEILNVMVELLIEQDRDLSSEEFYAHVYPGKAYDARDMNRSMSLITKAHREFLALQQYKTDKGMEYVYWLREMRERDWWDLLPKGVEFAKKRMERDLPEDQAFYFQQIQIEKVKQDIIVRNVDGYEVSEPIYRDMFDALDRFILLSKAYCQFLAKNHDKFFNTEHQNRFWKETLLLGRQE